MLERHQDSDRLIRTKCMKPLTTSLKSLDYVLTYVKNTITVNYDIRLLSDAPLFVRLFSRGSYCVYNTTIYVPSIHLELVQSKHTEDRNLATSKLLPHIMYIHDHSFITKGLFFSFLLNPRIQVHYFIYEFLFLKFVDHPFKETIVGGFLCTRHSKFLRLRLKSEAVEDLIKQTFELNIPTK